MDEKNDNKKTGANRRIHRRVNFHSRVRVVVPGERTSIDVYASDVSRGGMFLRSNQPLPKGKKVALEFETKNGPVRVDEGEIVWNKPFEPISIDGAPAGMGVKFKSVTEESRLRIEALIAETLQAEQKARPSPPPPKVRPPKLPPSVAQSPRTEAAPLPAPARLKLGTAARSIKPMGTEPAQARVADQGESDMLSSPPPPKARMLIFGGFVLTVAVVTFVTLLLIKPFGRTPDKNQPTSAPPEEIKTAAQPADRKEPVLEDTGKPAPVQTVPGTDTSEKAEAGIGVEAEKLPEKTALAEPEPEPSAPEPPHRVEAKSGPRVGLPVFSKTSTGWMMVVRAGPAVRVKHFTLKNPPRLALDFAKAEYDSAKRTLQSPTPFITRLRVGKQMGFVRFVMDFKGRNAPKYRIIKGKNQISVMFP